MYLAHCGLEALVSERPIAIACLSEYPFSNSCLILFEAYFRQLFFVAFPRNFGLGILKSYFFFFFLVGGLNGSASISSPRFSNSIVCPMAFLAVSNPALSN